MAEITSGQTPKASKNGMDVWRDIQRWAEQGWQAIPPSEYERLKWYGLYFRKATPGYFMLRVRVPGGILLPGQLRALSDITRRFGRDVLDLTTRQQVELRWIRIEAVPAVCEQLDRVGLNSLQTGADNVRNVTGCPVAGLDPDEVFDATPWVRQVTAIFLGSSAYADLPRKLNVAISGCRDDCAHADLNDVGLTPAIHGADLGFNLRLAGAFGSWGNQRAWLVGWVDRARAVEVCRQIIEIYRDHGPRATRKKARLRFLVADRGLEWFRSELQRRAGFEIGPAGTDLTRAGQRQDHVGVHPQSQFGRYYVGLLVPTGRLRPEQGLELCRLAEAYGQGEMRLTVEQNLIIPHVPGEHLAQLLAEPLLREMTPFPDPFQRGLVACTGREYCPFALIETKQRAREVAAELDRRLSAGTRAALRDGLSFHVAGCPNSCGGYQIADIGLLGKRLKVNDEVVEGCDVFLGGQAARDGAFGERSLRSVPFAEVADVLEGVVRAYLAERGEAESFRGWCVRTGRIAPRTEEELAALV